MTHTSRARDPIASYSRPLSELSPIKESPMYDQARERVAAALLCRTPIDPLTTILSPGVMKGNSDLTPTAWKPPSLYRDCTVCAGRCHSRGVPCLGCGGFGTVRR